MESGIYYVIFKSHTGRFGDGLVVVDNGKIHGGDQRYLYRGFYKTDGQTVEADIQVSYYRGEAKSVLGHIAKFKLNLPEIYKRSFHRQRPRSASPNWRSPRGPEQADLPVDLFLRVAS
jgi:hypothetical protein